MNLQTMFVHVFLVPCVYTFDERYEHRESKSTLDQKSLRNRTQRPGDAEDHRFESTFESPCFRVLFEAYSSGSKAPSVVG